MKKHLFLTALTSAAFLMASATAEANDYANNWNQNDHNYLSFGVGSFDVFDDEDTATDFRLEYRHGEPVAWVLKPWFGAEATSDGSVWGGGGVYADFMAAPAIYFTPSIGVGLYAQGGSDLDLGHPIEFRAQIEGGYQFAGGSRLGVAFGHMSNFGLDDENPGAEMLGLYYHMPVGALF